MSTHRFGNLLKWGPAYCELIDNPLISPYLAELLGPNFRLDHIYLDVIRSGKSPIGTSLHGSSGRFDPSQYYHFEQGKMYNGLTVVAYNLKDVNPGDGGFGCVPGTHKSNFPFPNDWRDTSENMAPCVTAVPGPAGSAVIFTEALTHGALPWHGKDERRTIFFKFSPHPISWSAGYFNAADYPHLTQRQREILESPNARYGSRPKS